MDIDLSASFFERLRSQVGLEVAGAKLVRRNFTAKDGLCFLYDPDVVKLASPEGVQSAPVPAGAAAAGPGAQRGAPGNEVITAVFEVTLQGHPAYGRRLGVSNTHANGKEPACTPAVHGASQAAAAGRGRGTWAGALACAQLSPSNPLPHTFEPAPLSFFEGCMCNVVSAVRAPLLWGGAPDPRITLRHQT